MAFWTYMIRCGDGSYYTGHTDDLEKRWGEHRSGALGGYTAVRHPLELVWAAEFGERIEALVFERRLKGWSRVKKEALIAGDWDGVRKLAQRRWPFETVQPAAEPPQGERKERIPTSQTVRPEEDAQRPSQRAPQAGTGPTIIFVRPQLGENIGKAARAMLNFGLTELRLVAPRDGWPNPAAAPAAAGADVVLENAKVYETTAEAVADCNHIYATTVRKRGVTKPVLAPEHAAAAIAAARGRSAILFGPERSGLETEDVDLARSDNHRADQSGFRLAQPRAGSDPRRLRMVENKSAGAADARAGRTSRRASRSGWADRAYGAPPRTARLLPPPGSRRSHKSHAA